MTEAASNLCAELIRVKGSPPIIGGIVLHRVIGSGGMGVVYQGTHLRLRVPVAVKFLVYEREDSFSVSRFIDEASLAARISSPNVVRVYDVNKEGGFEFIVQEFVNGTTSDQRLRDAIFRNQQLSEDFILELAADTARGLAAIHNAEYLHLDIKPANIMISQRDGGCKILDFGLARPFDKTIEIGTIPASSAECVDGGTPGYASPEQLQMLHVGPASDIYSLGVTIFELLTGRPAYSIRTWEEAQIVQTRDEVPDIRALRPNISSRTAELISKCVRINHRERFSSAMELLSEIAKIKQCRSGSTFMPIPVSVKPSTKVSAFKHAAPFVICVDDDAQICSFMAELLQATGFRVETFTSGSRALNRIQTELPDVVFLDMDMPEMSGMEVCRKLRSNTLNKNIPVVFITATTSPDVMRHAMSEGATDYLFKPIQVDDMISRVQCLSRISRAHQELVHLQVQFSQFRGRLSTLSGKDSA